MLADTYLACNAWITAALRLGRGLGMAIFLCMYLQESVIKLELHMLHTKSSRHLAQQTMKHAHLKGWAY
jgi:hypothetical protein